MRLLALGRHTFVFGVVETVGGCALGVWGCREGVEEGEKGEGKGEGDKDEGEGEGEEDNKGDKGMWVVVFTVGLLAVGWCGTVCGGVMVWWGV